MKGFIKAIRNLLLTLLCLGIFGIVLMFVMVAAIF